jgi:hypothetical protein
MEGASSTADLFPKHAVEGLSILAEGLCACERSQCVDSESKTGFSRLVKNKRDLVGYSTYAFQAT